MFQIQSKGQKKVTLWSFISFINMNKLYLLIIINLFCQQAFNQSNIRMNNYWKNPQYLNPATVYDQYVAVFSMAVRKQWVGFPGAPSTFFASGTTYVDNMNTQLGLSVVQDKVGFTSISNFNLSYAYAIKFEQNWQLHLGLRGSFQMMSYDISKLSLISDDDSELYRRLKSENSFNADLGLEVTNKTLKFGFASQSITSILTAPNPIQTNTNLLYIRYHQNYNLPINLAFGMCAIQYSNIYQLEFNYTSYFKIKKNNGLNDKPTVFDIGFFYRTQSEVGINLGFNITDNLHLSYSYDYHLGDIRRGSVGTNEIMITYNLRKKPVCHNCWY